MLAWLEQFLVRYPELALFLVIAAGYWIGSFKVGAFSLGPVTGALFAGLFVGQFAHVPVSGMTKSFLFLLFLFGIGYSVGPQFMQALKRDGLKPIVLAVVVCITGLAASILVAKALRLDPGFAAGLMTGALSQSAAIGTATDAVNGLALPEAIILPSDSDHTSTASGPATTAARLPSGLTASRATFPPTSMRDANVSA